MYRCVHCGGNHRKRETGQKCAETAARYGMRGNSSARVVNADTGASRAYDNWATSGRAERESEEYAEEERLKDTEVPNGYYFIPRENWAPNGLRIHVRRFDTGRWKGVWFITDYSGKDPELLTGNVADRQFVIEKLVQSSPLACMTQYGRVAGRCGVCNEELTEDEREKYGGHIECFRTVWEQRIVNYA